jgi:iron complex transport system substrate-binding protein
MNRKSQWFMIGAAATLLLAIVAWVAIRSAARSARLQCDAIRQIADMTDRPVRVPLRPLHILSVCTSATDTLVVLGLEDRLVAIDEYSRVVPHTDHAAVVGRGSAISREQVAAMGIDLAFVWWYQDDVAAMLDDLSIPVVRIRSGRVTELPAMIRLIGQTVDRREMADRAASRIETFLQHSPRQPAAGAKRVFIELYGPLKTAGGETFTNDLLELAGALNIAGDARGSVLLSAERLIQADPDVILSVGESSDANRLKQRLGASALKAVREGRVYAIDRYWLVAGPQMPESVKKIRDLIVKSSKP